MLWWYFMCTQQNKGDWAGGGAVMMTWQGNRLGEHYVNLPSVGDLKALGFCRVPEGRELGKNPSLPVEQQMQLWPTGSGAGKAMAGVQQSAPDGALHHRKVNVLKARYLSYPWIKRLPGWNGSHTLSFCPGLQRPVEMTFGCNTDLNYWQGPWIIW